MPSSPARAHDKVRALYAQARLIEAMWAAMGAILLGAATMAGTSSWQLMATVATCLIAGLVGAGLGYVGGCRQAATLRLKARTVEAQVRTMLHRRRPRRDPSLPPSRPHRGAVG